MEIIQKYFKDLSEKQLHQYQLMGEAYLEWNQKINVISRKDTDALYEKHILHALAIAKYVQFKAGTKLLDVGTGGGFPGIPLAVMFPECEFTLVDSIGKKIKVVQAVAEEIGLKNVTALHQRAEQTNGKFDFVVSRAVTRAERFLPWVKHKVNKKGFNEIANGYLFLKGGDLYDEFGPLQKYFEIHPLKRYFEEPFFETKQLVYLKA